MEEEVRKLKRTVGEDYNNELKSIIFRKLAITGGSSPASRNIKSRY
jgi:hypothetical protein